MRIKAFGKARLEGVAKKSGNPYNFNQVHYLGKARGVEGQAALTLALDSFDYSVDRIEVSVGRGLVEVRTTNSIGRVTTTGERSSVSIILFRICTASRASCPVSCRNAVIPYGGNSIPHGASKPAIDNVSPISLPNFRAASNAPIVLISPEQKMASGTGALVNRR